MAPRRRLLLLLVAATAACCLVAGAPQPGDVAPGGGTTTTVGVLRGSSPPSVRSGADLGIPLLALSGVAGFFTGYYMRTWHQRHVKADMVKARSSSAVASAAAALAPAAA